MPKAKRKLSAHEPPRTSKKIKLDALSTCSATDSIIIKLLDSHFHPAFTNQVINDQETIYGYRDLRIDVDLTPVTLRPYIRISYAQQQPGATDLDDCFYNFFRSEYATTQKEFQSWVKEDSAFQFSRSPMKTIRNVEPGGEKDYEIYTITTKDREFSKLNNQFQQLFIFFIDGASFIDVDQNWRYFILLCKTQKSIVGFATTYQVNEKLSRTATRISQFLILPPYQKRGLGKIILEAIYEDAKKNPQCDEITVEDPSEDFQNMRDVYDIRLILKEGYFSMFKKRDTITFDTYAKYSLSKEEVKKIHQCLKLTKSRVYA